MRKCKNGHLLDETNLYRHPSGYSRCKRCHADRMKARAREKKLATLPNRIAGLQAELDRLRQEYAADPRNFQLAKQVGVAGNAVIAARKQAAPKPQYVKPVAARHRDNREWGDALPAHCPNCGGWVAHSMGQERPLPTAGYSIRVGETGVRCTLCRHLYELEAN